ncbi:TonB-dependent receptor [soil metagenome]
MNLPNSSSFLSSLPSSFPSSFRLRPLSLFIAIGFGFAGSALAQQAPASADTQNTTLPTTTVEGRREKPEAGSRTVIGTDDMTREGVKDVAGIVRYQPLVTAPSAAAGSGNVWDGSGYTGYNIRGIEGNRIGLDVDGISMPEAAPKPDGATLNSFGIGRDYFDPETFREVRIDSGTSSSGQAGGQGLGGNVSFITKSPEDYLKNGITSFYGYKLGYQSVDNSWLNAFTGAQRFGDVQALIVYARRDGHETENNGSAPAYPVDWHSNALLAKFVWDGNRTHRFGLTIDHYDRKDDNDFSTKTSTTYPNGQQQTAETERTRVSLDYGFTPDAGSIALFDRLDARLYVQDARIEDETQVPVYSRLYSRDIFTGFYNKSAGAAVSASKAWGAHSFNYGLSFETTETRRPWSEVRTTLSTGAVTTGSKNRMPDTDVDKFSAHLRDEIGFDLGGHRATLTPGVRIEHRTTTPKNLSTYVTALPAASAEIAKETETFATPSLSLAVEMTPGFDVYGQYNRGTRIPSASEKWGTYDSFSYTGTGAGYAVLGNPDLKKETSDASEFGVRGTPTAGVTLHASAFYTRYRNFIEYESLSYADYASEFPTATYGLFRPQNIGRATISGVEFSSRFDLGEFSRAATGYSIGLAAGVAHGTARNTETGLRGDLASVGPAKGTLTLAYDDPGKRFGLSAAATAVKGKQASTDVIASSATTYYRVPGYGLLDLAAYWNVSRNVTLNLGLFNVFDRKYWDYASSRSLVPGTTAATLADIERRTMPGRTVAVSMNVKF